MSKFVCYECGRTLNKRELSTYSLELSGCRTRAEAIENLPEFYLICRECLDSEADYQGEIIGRGEVEKWSLSGLTLSRAERDWLRENY